MIHSNISRCLINNRPNNTTGIDKVHLKCDCIDESILYGVRQPIVFSFTLVSPPGQKTCKELRMKLFKKINEPALSDITNFLEDDDHKAVNFFNEAMSFTCQLIKL